MCIPFRNLYTWPTQNHKYNIIFLQQQETTRQITIYRFFMAARLDMYLFCSLKNNLNERELQQNLGKKKFNCLIQKKLSIIEIRCLFF